MIAAREIGSSGRTRTYNPPVNRTVFARQFNYFAAQMTTLGAVENQRVTRGARISDPYLTRTNLGQIRVTQQKSPAFQLEPSSCFRSKINAGVRPPTGHDFRLYFAAAFCIDSGKYLSTGVFHARKNSSGSCVPTNSRASARRFSTSCCCSSGRS